MRQRERSGLFDRNRLVAAGGVVLLALSLLASRAHHGHRLKSVSSASSPSTLDRQDAQGEVLESMRGLPRAAAELIREPYVHGLIGVSALGALAALLIDFQFYAGVTSSGNTSAEFFSGFYSLLYFLALVLQLTLFLFSVTSSHGLFDAMTDGGLGVAFFSPFDNTRYFLPWRPIHVSPIGLLAFLNQRGLQVLLSNWSGSGYRCLPYWR